MEGSILQGDVTPVTADDSIHTIFQQLAANNPEKHGVIFEGREWTMAEVNSAANRMARRIRREIQHFSLQGSRDNKIVCLLMSPSAERVIAILALLKLGLAYLPLEVVIPPARIKYIMRETNPMCLICSEDLYPHINTTDMMVENYKRFIYENLAKGCESLPDGNITDDEAFVSGRFSKRLAIVLYTSGSTGVPKGVRLTHGNILNRLRWQWRQFPYISDDVGIAKTSMLFVDSVTEVWGCLLQAVPIVIVPKCVTQNPKIFIETLEKYQVSCLVLVPSLLRNMLVYLNMVNDSDLLQKLKYVVCSGETLPIELAKDFFSYFKTGHTLANYYGSTEMTGDITYDVFTQLADVERKTFNKKISIGTVVDNCTAYIVDDNLKPVNLGEVGELIVSGQNIADGYMDKNHMTNFIPNTLGDAATDPYLLKTGDYARIIDGRIFYEGRKDSQVKIRGQKVDTAEISRVLQEHDAMGQVVVLIYRGKPGDPTIIAFYTVNEGSEVTDEQLLAFCKESLPTYMVPTLQRLETVPLLPATGKIDRQGLVQLYEQSLRGADGEAVFADETTSKIINIVASQVGLHPSHVKLEQNFFNIGGNSVNAIMTISKLAEAGFKIDIGDFLAAKTLQDLVTLATEASTSSPEDVMTKLEKKYRAVPVGPGFEDEDAVLDLLTDAFVKKDVLSIECGTNFEEFRVGVKRTYDGCLTSGANLAVYKRETGELVGASMAGNIAEMPSISEIFAEERTRLIGDALRVVEELFTIEMKGKWLTSALNAANSGNSKEENVEIIELMERKTIDLGREQGYAGIETVNASQLTLELCRMLGYQSLGEVKVVDITGKDGQPLLPNAPPDAFLDPAVIYL